MTTVKEFKDLGLTPIIGDEYTFMDRKNIEYFKSIRGSDESWAGQLETDRGIYDDDQLDMLTPLSFSWRPNTGVKPAFKGLIDICFEDGTISYGEENLFEWSLDDESFISKWRPSLDQSALKPVNGAAVKPSDDKQVFTQAMADRGELPPVGSYFTVSGLVGECLLIHCGDIIAKFNTGVMPVNKHECKPIDTRTPKQKAIDDIVKMLHSEGVVAFDPIMLHIMYEKGFIKC